MSWLAPAPPWLEISLAVQKVIDTQSV